MDADWERRGAEDALAEREPLTLEDIGNEDAADTYRASYEETLETVNGAHVW